MAKELDLAVLAWPPLGSALLSGKYKKTDGKAAG
jgi:aryl-alcohol dehydrogenase-like predicted oxidoreductase